MKQKDAALLIVVAVVSGIVSIVAAHLVFAPPKNRHQSVEVVDAIQTDFPLPDSKYFNNQSVDATQLIRVSENTNTSPFNGHQ